MGVDVREILKTRPPMRADAVADLIASSN